MSKSIYTAQTQNLSFSGNLSVNVTSALGFIPVKDASITISLTSNPDTVVETLTTDNSGQTQSVSLPAPNISYSKDPANEIQPYAEYNIAVSAPGYEDAYISGTEILADRKSVV